MAVDDLWYLKKRDGDDNRLPSKRHGRGKRWRVRWTDPLTGRDRQELFAKKSDAELADVNRQADISRGQYIDPRAGQILVAQYVRQWESTLMLRDSSAERIEQVIRLHVIPVLGTLAMSAVRASHIKTWVKGRGQAGLEPASIHLAYNGVIAPMFQAAVVDKVIGTTPCVGITLPEIEKGEHYIPTPEQVHALYDALPEHYRAVAYVAAGCGLRGGEIMGLEKDCIDFLRREIHVRQQLKVVSGRKPFLGDPKTKQSVRTVDLPDVVGEALAVHLAAKPAVACDLYDEAAGKKGVRTAEMMFTSTIGTPITRSNWSGHWRKAVAAVGLPEGFGLHGLRHYYATVLIFGGANVKTVQLRMGHKTPTVTLNTYLGYWPNAVDQTRSLVDSALTRRASTIQLSNVRES